MLATNVALSSLGTPVSLISAARGAGAVDHLQLSITLPSQTETTANGVLPTGTIQGPAALTWTFTEAQRTAAATTS